MGQHGKRDLFAEVRDSDSYHVEAAKLDFAIDLRNAMQREGISNTELAQRLCVSKPMVSKLLSGDTNVTIETMVKVTRRVHGTLLVKIVRNGCKARLFEIAQAEHERSHGAIKWQVSRPDSHHNARAESVAWESFERVVRNRESSDEANSVAA